jgi:ParB/RepB/Spo0J family partition protein
MKEEKIVFENPKNLVVDKNSRWRADSNLSELMESIKQNGILQPIVARTEDRVIICGNRRLSASIKLQLPEIPVRYMSGVSDKELLILNLLENMQRKDISSLEIGRTCSNMLRNTAFKTSVQELATALGVSPNRIKTCLNVFNSLPPEFRERVIHLDSSRERKIGDLPENVVDAILNFGKQFKKLNNNDMVYLLKKSGDELYPIGRINLIGRLYSEGLSLKKAVSLAEDYTLLRINTICLKTELASAMKKEGATTKGELFKKIVKEKYPQLLF